MIKLFWFLPILGSRKPLPRVSLSGALSCLENRNHFAIAVLCSWEDVLPIGTSIHLHLGL